VATEVDELFTMAPAEFVPARNALAKALKADGHRDEVRTGLVRGEVDAPNVRRVAGRKAGLPIVGGQKHRFVVRAVDLERLSRRCRSGRDWS